MILSKILLEFQDVFEERVGEFEGKLTLQTEPDAVSIKLQICLYPNHYHCQVPSLESIIHRFAIKKPIKFSKLDIRSGFWHSKMNNKARELMAFGMPQGNYQYKRLFMGITPASKRFQAKMVKHFQGVNGVCIIQDNCLVEGFGHYSDQAINNYNQNLWAYLQKRNIKINLDNSNSSQRKLSTGVIH